MYNMNILDTDTSYKLAPAEESFIDADDLIEAIGQNDSWFKQIFKRVD